MEFDFKDMVEWFLNLKQEYGVGIVFFILNIFWFVAHRSSFTNFYQSVWAWMTAGFQITYYRAGIDELKAALAEERETCGKQLDELRAIIERQQVQIDELREREMSNREELATLKERLTKHVGTTSRGGKRKPTE